MGQCWVLLLTLLYNNPFLAASQHWRTGKTATIYGLKRLNNNATAFRVKHGTHSLVNPTFQTSLENVNLLFEILLAGRQTEGEGRPVLIPDAELASLRRVDKLEVICEDVLPKRLSEIRRLTSHLSQQRGRLSTQDLERTMLTVVRTAQTLAQATSDHQRKLLSDSLVQLFKAIQQDLDPP